MRGWGGCRGRLVQIEMQGAEARQDFVDPIRCPEDASGECDVMFGVVVIQNDVLADSSLLSSCLRVGGRAAQEDGGHSQQAPTAWQQTAVQGTAGHSGLPSPVPEVFTIWLIHVNVSAEATCAGLRPDDDNTELRNPVPLRYATAMTQRAQSKNATLPARRVGKRDPVPDRDAEATRAEILAVATEEFAAKGLSGSRVDEIAERTHTVKRMIYYYYGSKEGLYRAVLESAYDHIRTIESDLDLDALPPVKALRQLVTVTFDYHNKHPEFVRLVMNENIHRGAHIGDLPNIKERNRTVIATLRNLIDRGVKAGEFRTDLDPVELHMTISALCFYNVSNRYTFSTIFGRDMTSVKAAALRREAVADIVEKWCRPDR